MWGVNVKIHVMDEASPLWQAVADYAETCSWSACARMASFMRAGKFSEWERIFAAEENGVVIGFCALLKAQSFPGAEYSPLIKWLFVEEKHRGKRLSQQLIEAASGYAKSLGYDRVYLTTWHKGLYEKYDFAKIAEKEVREGYSEGVYEKRI
jgi:GNAT superfamily N-acetyltransferase